MDFNHKERHETAVKLLNEYILVAEQGFTYLQLGYSTIEGEIPAVQLVNHWHIQSTIAKHTPKPKKSILPPGASRAKHHR